MPKLKNLLPGIFGQGKDASKESNGNADDANPRGRLETDALPMPDNDNDNASLTPSVNNTPTASAELTESVVRELSDPNYNSVEMANNRDVDAGAMVAMDSNAGALALPANTSMAPMGVNTGAGAVTPATMNTMNVHNAQQQMVMQFSNIKQLHFGSVYNFNGNLTTSANSSRKSSTIDEPTTALGGGSAADGGKRQLPRKTTTIVTMMQSQMEPSHRMLDTIATHLGEGWKLVMRELGHSEGQIEQAIIDHQMHGGIKEVIYQLLLQWQRDADDGVATMGHLTTLLWELNYRDCVLRMKLAYKSETDRRRKTDY